MVGDLLSRANLPAGGTAGALIIASLLFSACGDESTNDVVVDGPGLGDEVICDVTFGVTNDVNFVAVDFEVDYTHAPGVFVGEGIDMQCTRLVEGSHLLAARLCDLMPNCVAGRDRVLRIAFATNNVTAAAPIDIVSCRFEGRAVPRARNFRVVPAPEGGRTIVAVTAIDCSDSGGLGTTTTTSTTVLGCGAEVCAIDQVCLGGECVPTTRYEVDFSLADAVEFAALEVRVAYDWRAGSIAGDRSTTQCRINSSLNLLAVFSDWVLDAGGVPVPPWEGFGDVQLTGAIISALNVRGPVRLATCLYQSFNATPLAESFRVWAVAAADSTFHAVDPLPTLIVSEVRPVAPLPR